MSHQSSSMSSSTSNVDAFGSYHKQTLSPNDPNLSTTAYSHLQSLPAVAAGNPPPPPGPRPKPKSNRSKWDILPPSLTIQSNSNVVSDDLHSFDVSFSANSSLDKRVDRDALVSDVVGNYADGYSAESVQDNSSHGFVDGVTSSVKIQVPYDFKQKCIVDLVAQYVAADGEQIEKVLVSSCILTLLLL